MARIERLFCAQCARPGALGTPFCPHCGASRALSPQLRAGHVAFLLSELDAAPLRDVLDADQRAAVETHYEDELIAHLAAQAQGTPARTAAVPAPAVATAMRPGRAAPLIPPNPPREPYDWSWLAEQQANLFLFAGAFLTVVAALIYVGYSGQAVDGSPKMSLLVAYTLAFLAAGWLCLRYPSVEIAGRVFFGVGAMLVPLNFAAARSILSDEDLSAEAMWLAGSLTTAAFYAAVAWLGLGRIYALGSGAAVISGTIAAGVASNLAPEWSPLLFIAVAFGMTLTNHTGIDAMRDRIGAVWSPLGQAAAAAALGFALLMAPSAAADAEWWEVTTLWFLPVAFAAFAAAAAALGLLTKREYLGAAALAAIAAGGVSIAYALELRAEGWVVTIGAVAACLGVLVPVFDDGRVTKTMPARAGEYVFGYGVALTAITGFVAVVLLLGADGGGSPYDVHQRWFLAAASMLTLAFYALAACSKGRRRGETGALVSAGLVASVAGSWVAIIYGFGWPAEAYAIGIAAMAPAFGLAMIAARHPRVTPLLPERLVEIAYMSALGATVVSSTVAFFTILAANEDVDPYELRTRWFLIAALAPSLVFYCIDALALRRLAGVPGFVVALTGVCVSVVYGLDASTEYYAFALTAPAIALIAAVRWAPARLDRRLAAGWRNDVVVLTRAATGGGVLVAAFAAIIGADPEIVWEPQSHVFLPLAFLCAAAFLGSDASRGKRVETSLAFVVMLGAAAVTVPYAFQAEAAFYGVALVATGILFAGSGWIWAPWWLDGRTRDGMAVLAVAASTLPFEGAYAGLPGIGAGVHLARRPSSPSSRSATEARRRWNLLPA